MTESAAIIRLRAISPLLLAALGVAFVAFIVTALTLRAPFVGGALIYAGVFVTIAWLRPEIALMLIFAGAPFQHDLSTGGPVRFSIAEINLALAFPVFVARSAVLKRPMTPGPIALPVAFYFIVCLYSCLRTWWGDQALASLVQMFLYLVLTVMMFSSFAKREVDLLLSFYGLIVVGVGLTAVMFVSSMGVLGLNKNGLGASLACALVVAIEMWFVTRNARRRWILSVAMAIMLTGLIFTLSRGSWLTAIFGAMVIACLRREFVLFFRISMIVVPVMVLCWHFLPQESRAYATGFDRDKNYSINERYRSVDVARGFYEQSPIYGVGVGLRKRYDATNLAWMLLAETGVLGLVTFTLVHVVVLAMIWQGHTFYARSDARFSLLAIGGALLLGKLAHGMVDICWSRGDTMIVWAAVGMATGAYYIGRARKRLPLTRGPAQKLVKQGLKEDQTRAIYGN